MTLSRRDVLAGLPPLLLAAQVEAALELAVEELDLFALRVALDSKRVTSVQLVKAYLARIQKLDAGGPALKSVIELNPDALKLAAERDAEKPRGPLHGIPVLVKDNLDTADAMKTTAGSLALLDAPTPKRDAFVVQRLRDAGAVLLGKTNLAEWANLRGEHSVSGWSARGGLTRNPYVTTRNPSGSSSGSAVAVAASLCGAAIGTETDGSIVSPASICGVVGFKPSLGLVSRAGIIPLAHSQDTAGPMTRTVRDAAVMMNALVGVDERDVATEAFAGKRFDFVGALEKASLRGVRLGVVRAMVNAGHTTRPVAEATLEKLKQAGATLVDVALPTREAEPAELELLMFELKADLEAYLRARGGPMKSLADVIAFNHAHADQELTLFGQEYFERASTKGPLTSPEYLAAKATCVKLGVALREVLEKNQLAALVAPTGSPAWLTDLENGDHPLFAFTTAAAVAGAPHATVPMGFVGELPVSLSFVGAVGDDVRVVALAYAFEQLTHARRPPRYFTR